MKYILKILMKNKFELFSVIIFAAIFFAGWEFGISPIRQSLMTVRSQTELLKERVLSGREALRDARGFERAPVRL